jgi:hypothetical protein
MPVPGPASERLHLAEANLDLLAVSLAKAVEAGADRDEVVALLLDTRDHLARELAAAIVERQGGLDLDQEEARVLGRGQIPTAIAVLPLRLVELLFAETHPAVSSGVRRAPPQGRLRVVVVAAGGATLLHLPVASVSTGSA